MLVSFLAGSAVAAAKGPAGKQTVPPALPDDRAGVRRLLSSLGGGFRATTTTHFVVVSDVEAPRVDRLGRIAESTLTDVTAFADRLGLPLNPPPAKMCVLFFNRRSDYAGHARRAGFHVGEVVPGFFAEQQNRCLIFNYANAGPLRAKRADLKRIKAELVDQRRRGGTPEAQAVIDRRHRRIREIESRIRIYEDLITKTVVRHEIAHQVLFNYGLQPRGASNPRWLREGLAMQFEAPAGVNRHRMEDFLALDRAGLRLNLRDLIADPEYLGPGAADLPGRYAAAWALVHRLVHERPRALAAYLEISSRPAATGEPVVPEAAKFQATFGKLDTAFERKLVTYVEALSRQPTSTASTPAGER